MQLLSLLICLVFSPELPLDSIQKTSSYTISVKQIQSLQKKQISQKKKDVMKKMAEKRNKAEEQLVKPITEKDKELEKIYQGVPLQVGLILDSVKQTQLVSSELEHMAEAYKKMISNSPQYNGYTIQLYAGTKKKALGYRSEFVMHFPKRKVFITYENLNYVVQFGKYLNRLSANIDLKTIQEKFRHAYLVRAKIPYITLD